MTYPDLLLAAQLMSEERVGAPMRKHQRQEALSDAEKLGRLQDASRSRNG